MVGCMINGYVLQLFINTTEDKLKGYLDSELKGKWKKYTGATDEEIACAKKLRLPIYEY